MKHLFDPGEAIMNQLRGMGVPEHLPVEQAIVYRFFDAGNRLLYVGVTVSPRGRWQAHKNTSSWWPEVRAVNVEFYPHERAALDAEVIAIKAERPPFNRRSVPATLTRDSCAAHEDRMSDADAILPRVGGGVGVRVGFGKQVKFSTHLISPPANRGDASAAPRQEVSR